MDNVGEGQMNRTSMAAKMKVLVAVEKFKSDLATMGLDEVEIQDALDAAVSRTTGLTDILQAMMEVKDELTLKRVARWDSETKDATSYTAGTKAP